jgi:hypothetical protein
VDKDKCVALIALHKCGIESAHIFESLKPLNILHVKLFLDMGGVSDCKISGWPCVVCTPQVINAVRSRINQNPVCIKKKIMAQEMDIASRTMSRIIKQDLGLSNDKQNNALLLH